MLYRYPKVGGAVLRVIIRKWVGLVTVWAVQVIFEGGWGWALAANLCSAHIFVAP